MAEHGYAREYDEPIDRGDDDHRRDRGEHRERDWRSSESRWNEQRDPEERNFMFGGRGRDWQGRSDQRRGSERGFFRSRQDRGGSFDQGPTGERWPRDFSSHQDDHYRSWRNRQMEALDRDYADYCREREQQFHRDFDSWRQNRQTRNRGQEPQSMSPEEVMELDNPAGLSTEPQSAPSPTADATLGTNNSENVAPGRR